jgi:hypothetical protein
MLGENMLFLPAIPGNPYLRKLFGMETLFAAVSFSLFVLAILTFVTIVREVFPLLNPEDQTSLRNYGTGSYFRALSSRDRAIGNAWNEHARSFPKSRKRTLFASFLIATALSVMGYPLWLAFGAR